MARVRNFVFELSDPLPGDNPAGSPPVRKMRRVSDLTRKANEMTMPQGLTKERIQDWAEGRKLIQEAFPDLNADQREFILTGATPEEWEALFGEEDEPWEDDSLKIDKLGGGAS